MIEKQWAERLGTLAFIELKKDISLGEVRLSKELPLPIRTQALVEGIQTQELADHLDLEKILDGILYLMGLDENFIHRKEYEKIFFSSLKEPVKYTMSKAIEAEKHDPIDAWIYLKGYENLDPTNNEVFFTLTSLMETIYNNQLEIWSDEQKNESLRTIIKRYENLIARDMGFDLPYLRLGYINLALKRYLKSKLYFEKFLLYSQKEELKEEVRIQLDEIEDYAAMESAQTYVSYGKFEEAIAYLKKIGKSYPLQDYLNYLLGLCYHKLGRNSIALEFAEETCKNSMQEEYTNLLGMIYLQQNKLEICEKTYRQGIANNPESYLLNYNLGLILAQEKKYMQSIKFLKKAYQIQNSKEVLTMIEQMEKKI